MSKVVQISLDKFKKFVKNYVTIRRQNRELRKINKFLNDQIKDYNEKFGGIDNE